MANALAVILGIALAVALPGWGVFMLIAYACLCAWETRRLKNRLDRKSVV